METKYVNIRIIGDQTPGTVNLKHAVYSETSTAPILQDSSKWSLSVVRFNLTTNEMPVYVFEDVPGSGVYKYKVVLRLGTLRTEAPVNFIEGGSQSPYESTFAFYSYNGIIDSINFAYYTAFLVIQADYISQVGPWPATFPTEPPKLRLLADNSLQFFFQPSYYSSAFSIGVNPALVNKMGSFSWYLDQDAPYDALLDISDKKWNHVTYDGADYLYTNEPGKSIQNWNSVRKIVFKTSIPIESEYRSGQSVDRDQVLTDFDLSGVIDGTDINFFPTGPLREYPMYNRSALYEMSLRVLWRDRFGVDHKWLLGPDDIASMKIQFQRRHTEM
jgi:hypothetical protein